MISSDCESSILAHLHTGPRTFLDDMSCQHYTVRMHLRFGDHDLSDSNGYYFFGGPAMRRGPGRKFSLSRCSFPDSLAPLCEGRTSRDHDITHPLCQRRRASLLDGSTVLLRRPSRLDMVPATPRHSRQQSPIRPSEQNHTKYCVRQTQRWTEDKTVMRVRLPRCGGSLKDLLDQHVAAEESAKARSVHC